MGEGNDNSGAGEDTKPKRGKKLRVRVLRAVDNYHHRNTVLTVPDDEYHRGLIAIGNLRLEED